MTSTATAAAATPGAAQPAPPPPPQAQAELAPEPAWTWLPPAHVLRTYALAWLPILVIYMVSVETDGIWTRGFNLFNALYSTLRNMGPAFLLLLLLWPLMGWMEGRRFGAARQVLVHGGTALLYSFAYYGLLWVVTALAFGVAAAERARENWFIWQIQFGMLFYAAAAGAFAAYRAVQRARREAAAAAQAQTLLARTELAALRNKLNPHFLFNTLHSILALVRKDAVRAEQALFGFSEMLRYLLDTERSGDDQVLLRDELAFTEQYLALESIRLGDRLKIDWQVDEEALAVSIPALTVQPLVENSVKHAFNPRSEHGTLTVRVQMAGERVEITVADDGPGLQLPADGSLPTGDGLGLPTVARRLALRWGDAASFKVQSAPGAGFQVRVTLPK